MVVLGGKRQNSQVWLAATGNDGEENCRITYPQARPQDPCQP